MIKKIQYRGNCQACGHQQAVTRGLIAKHGYKVRDHWFQGTCPGSGDRPLQSERDAADKHIVGLSLEIEKMEAALHDLDFHDSLPIKAKIHAYRAHIDYMAKVADEKHGTPLVEVIIDTTPPEPIRKGDQRITEKGNILTVVRISGPRVYWTSSRGAMSWTGTTAWRKMPKPESVTQ